MDKLEVDSTKVLVVRGSSSSADATVRDLRRQGYVAHSVETGADALKIHQVADLVLLDLELPDIDGLEVCKAIRANADTPIISFADQDAELERVLALQAGSDDCVVTSCGPRELMARIEAVMRRMRPRLTLPQSISLHPLHIDGKAREVYIDDQVVPVTAKEFDLLYVLAANPESVISRKELMARIWESSTVGTSRTIDTHVSSLRAKLGAGEWIVTVRGVGYRIGRACGSARISPDEPLASIFSRP